MKFSLHKNINNNNNNNNNNKIKINNNNSNSNNTFLYGAFTKLNAPTSPFIANKLEQKCRVEKPSSRIRMSPSKGDFPVYYI